jgi:hypothetical protein
MNTELPSNTPPVSAALTLDVASFDAGSRFVPHAAIAKMASAPAIPHADINFSFMAPSSESSSTNVPVRPPG